MIWIVRMIGLRGRLIIWWIILKIQYSLYRGCKLGCREFMNGDKILCWTVK